MTSEESHGPSISAELLENLREIYGDVSHEELLQEQECVLQSLQVHGRERGGNPDPVQSSDFSPFSVQEGEFSRSISMDSQDLDLDEALALSLEELRDDLVDSHISEIYGHTADSSREILNPSAHPVTAGSPDVSQDEVNPDDMSYEQLQALGDSIGTEGTGLPEEFISNLRSFEYQPKNEECVICKENYKQGDKMTILPCSHKYHTECIKPWLMRNKTCPVCKEEVRDY